MTDDEHRQLLAAILAGDFSRVLGGLVVDHDCPICGESATTIADWRVRPLCPVCGGEMVDGFPYPDG